MNNVDINAIDFAGSKISIAHNKFNILGRDWLRSSQWHKVNVLNNTFGAFDTVSLENPNSEFGKVECIFKHNSFTEVKPDSFKSISEKCQFTELMFKQNCDCNFHKWLEKRFAKLIPLKQLQSETFCSLGANDILLRCLKAETVKFDQYHEEICKGKRSKLKCDKLKVEKINATFIDSKELSDNFDWMEYIHYIIAAVLCILVVSCVCIAVAVGRKPRNVSNDHYSQGAMHHQTDLLQLSQSEGPPSYEASLRPTKLFSGHDHIIIKKTLELMKQKQPKDKYDLVFNNTKRLLNEHINEYQKVGLIGDIVQTIGECENSSEDFVAFTDILYRHLAPDSSTTPRNAALATAEPGPPPAAQSRAKSTSEHIYAEPTVFSQQQIPLLLSNNYSNPLDSNAANNNNVYSEPVIVEQKVGMLELEFNLMDTYKIQFRIINLQTHGGHSICNQSNDRSANIVEEPSRHRESNGGRPERRTEPNHTIANNKSENSRIHRAINFSQTACKSYSRKHRRLERRVDGKFAKLKPFWRI